MSNKNSLIELQSKTFVYASELFKNCTEALGQFNCGDFDVTFGDARHTLIDKSMFYGMLDDAGLAESVLSDCDHPLKEKLIEEVKTIHERLDELSDSVFIDLEN